MSTVDVTEIWSSLRAQIEAHRPDVRSAPGFASSPSIPVAVLTGYLGAGKSTVLAHLLENPRGLRIRALVNDVGSLPFDPTLVGVADDVRVELTNGCGCCTTSDDLAVSLDVLASGGDCDLIVLEASGAADPQVLMHIVAANQALRLDRVVTVVSALALSADVLNARTFDNFDRQIASANCIVVSGCDAVTGAEVELALNEAARRAPGRVVVRSGLDHVASEILMPGSLRGACPFTDGPTEQHTDLCVVTVTPASDVKYEDFESALERARPALVRAKGRLIVDGRTVRLQVTPQSITIEDCETGPTGVTLIATDRQHVDDLVRVLRHTSGFTDPFRELA